MTVYPADTPAEEVLKTNPDGIMLSNGPGDPAENTEIIKEAQKGLMNLMFRFLPSVSDISSWLFATGANTYKLKYGHQRRKSPGKDLRQVSRVYISS